MSEQKEVAQQLKELREEMVKMCRELKICPKCKLGAKRKLAEEAIYYFKPPIVRCPKCGDVIPTNDN